MLSRGEILRARGFFSPGRVGRRAHIKEWMDSPPGGGGWGAGGEPRPRPLLAVRQGANHLRSCGWQRGVEPRPGLHGPAYSKYTAGILAPQGGFEPPTKRLTAARATVAPPGSVCGSGDGRGLSRILAPSRSRSLPWEL